MIRTPSSRTLYSAKPKAREHLPLTTTEIPKSARKAEDDVFSARMNTAESKTRLRYTSQTPSSSYNKSRNIIEFSDAKAFIVKTISSTTTKSIKSTQETRSLNSITVRKFDLIRC